MTIRAGLLRGWPSGILAVLRLLGVVLLLGNKRLLSVGVRASWGGALRRWCAVFPLGFAWRDLPGDKRVGAWVEAGHEIDGRGDVNGGTTSALV